MAAHAALVIEIIARDARFLQLRAKYYVVACLFDTRLSKIYPIPTSSFIFDKRAILFYCAYSPGDEEQAQPEENANFPIIGMLGAGKPPG